MHLRFAAPTLAILATGTLLLSLTGCTQSSSGAAPSKSPRPTAVAAPSPSATVTPTPSVTEPASEGSPEPTASTEPAPAQTSTSAAPVSGTYPAAPLITFASWDAASKSVQASGLVTGQIDASGICRLTLSKGSALVSRDSKPQPNASSVACGTFEIPGSQLSSGTWNASLSYVVGTRKVASAPQTVVVP